MEKNFKKSVYEHFHGPLIYNAKKVAAQEAAADKNKTEETRKRLTRKKTFTGRVVRTKSETYAKRT